MGLVQASQKIATWMKIQRFSKQIAVELRLHTLAGFGKTLAPEATAIADELLQRGLQPLALDA